MPADGCPEVPEHPALTRRGQFSVKKKIKDEKDARKGKGKGKGTTKGGKGKGKNKKGKGRGSKAKGQKAGKRSKLAKMKKLNCKTKAAQNNKRKHKAVAQANVGNGPSKTSNKGSKKDKVDQVSLTPAKSVPKPKSSLKGKAKPSKEVATPPVDLELQTTLVETFKSCGGLDGCTEDCHDFDLPEFEAVQFSYYWKKNAVGVTLDKEYLIGDEIDTKTKQSKSRYQHVAYFGSGNCTMCNIILATKWVP